MNTVEVNTQLCKGCYLCMDVCVKEALTVADKRNAMGAYPVESAGNGECTGCGLCALICPDAAIAVYRNGQSA